MRVRRYALSAAVLVLTVILPAVPAAPAGARSFVKAVVTSVSPRRVTTLGGAIVTVRGHYFHRSRIQLEAGTRAYGVGATHLFSTTLLQFRTYGIPPGTWHVVVYNLGDMFGSHPIRADVITAVAPPRVDRVSPASGPARGGNRVTLTGANFYGVTRVTFGSRVATPVHVASSTSLTAIVPASQPALVDIQVTGSFGHSDGISRARYRYVAPASALHWTAAPRPDTGTATIAAVSCVSATFCMAVDSSGVAYRWDGSTWTTTPTGEGVVSALSCSSSSNCLLLGSEALRWDGSTWTTIEQITGGPNVLSCASDTECVVVTTDGKAERWDGTSWTSAGDSGYAGSLSCPAVSFCLLGTENGVARSWDGTAWTDVRASGALNSLAVSCVSATFCGAAGYGDDRVRLWNGSTWHSLPAEPVETGVRGVQCSSTTACVEVGQDRVRTFDGFTWSAPVAVTTGDAPLLSCAPTGSCLMVGSTGDVTVGLP